MTDKCCDKKQNKILNNNREFELKEKPDFNVNPILVKISIN